MKKKLDVDWETLESRLVLAAVVLLIGLSIIDAIWRLSERWTIPAIFLSLGVVLKLSLSSRKAIDDVKSSQVAPVELNIYEDGEQFYNALRKEASAATQSIESTYVRKYPPTLMTKVPAASLYFEGVIEWSRVGGRHSVRRVFGRGAAGDGMHEWLADHYKSVKGIENYRVRVIDWPSDIPAINLAIIDSRIVFLLLSAV
jgi:hypothetical protein